MEVTRTHTPQFLESFACDCGQEPKRLRASDTSLFQLVGSPRVEGMRRAMSTCRQSRAHVSICTRYTQQARTHTHTRVCMCVYIYMYVCTYIYIYNVFICTFTAKSRERNWRGLMLNCWERGERERERETERERERDVLVGSATQSRVYVEGACHFVARLLFGKYCHPTLPGMLSLKV